MQNSTEYKFQLKEIPKEQRPREKLIKYGPDVLKNEELMAIILNTGYREETVMELSHRIIKEYGSKAIAQEKNVGRLMENLGIPLVKACQIVACFELGRRFFPAIEYLSAGIIIAHNHPSGDPNPSEDDLAVTRQMVEVGKTMAIEVLDHIIIGNERYVSLKDKGLM